MRFRLPFVMAFMSICFLLTGCMGQTQTGQDGQRMMTENTRNTMDRHTTNREMRGRDSLVQNVDDRNDRSSNNSQDRFDVSKEAANRIVNEIADIDQAHVIISRRNAYVAAMPHHGGRMAGDPITENNRNEWDNGTIGMKIRNPNDRNAVNRTENNMGTTNQGTDSRGQGEHEFTEDVRNSIVDIVRDVDRRVKNVYVTSSPDFFDLAHNYSRDIDDGKPVRGFFDQIGNTIERIFPQR